MFVESIQHVVSIDITEWILARLSTAEQLHEVGATRDRFPVLTREIE